ncbi:MAG: hypothetical protein A3H31_04425 [Gallionellales bacterium RIFCSPLOWO2_02_FULL_57_47]|nr:MAG: hypothetical protein A3H31_04425 [Gallionellales bacterium RIFCSPLOWO2_02_FULL_57_47]OGT17585.1 MAG: hypothetical protein A3J49_07015 [Gallionellales bacterium RIFCSPHIGHO2_02_FULL_57_16]
MSFDGGGKPGMGSGAPATKLNGMPSAVTRAVKADRLQREPARGLRRKTAATKVVITTIGHEAAPTFFWGGKAARAKAKYRWSLEPDG